MLGISSSIFNEAGSVVRDWLKNPLNSAFFFWYFLPAVGFVLLHLFIIGPILGRPVPQLLTGDIPHATSATDLVLMILNASFFQLILLPLVLGVLLSALSVRVLRLYQGNLPMVRPFFQPWLTRNRRRNVELYTKLRTLRRQYLFLVSQNVLLENINGEEKAKPVTETERDALIDKLKQETQALHEELESTPTAPDLPVDIDRVGATELANTLAVAEEYPFERYAMDAAVFWPRLSAELEAEKADGLKASFATMSGLLNLSLLIYVFAVEFAVVIVAILAGWNPVRPNSSVPQWVAWLPNHKPAVAGLTLVLVFVLAVIGYGAYRAAIASARAVGNAMRTAFDYYRGNILRRFNLKMPNDLEEERVLWLKLAAFIRRGESFYYPSEYRS
ncbi:MAG TPA: hypothetical protein VGQ72_04705 [Pyrinomonadaceae bacterium]|jgi:hypothetical protein|nr:hypothetical protein [Pyrinomonadaceae bacterium]